MSATLVGSMSLALQVGIFRKIWLFIKNGWLMSVLLPFNPFVPNAPFLYHLTTSENHKVFWCFLEVEKGYIGNEWVHPFHAIALFLYLKTGFMKKLVSCNGLKECPFIFLSITLRCKDSLRRYCLLKKKCFWKLTYQRQFWNFHIRDNYGLRSTLWNIFQTSPS